MNMQWKLTAGAAALAFSFGANAGIVDLFSTDQAILEDTTNGGFNSTDALYSQVGGVGDLTILGGFRDLAVSAISGADDGIDASSIRVSGGSLTFNNDTGVYGQGQVQWDGDDSGGNIFDIDYTGLGGLDLTLGGTADAFQVTTLASDQGWVFEITMYTDATNWTMVSLDADSVCASGCDFTSPHISLIPFTAFTDDLLCGSYGAAPGVNAITCGGTGADPTNLGALVVTLNVGDPNAPDGTGSAPQDRTVAVDLRLDSITTTVPEPGVLALMGMGLMAAGLASRRRKIKA